MSNVLVEIKITVQANFKLVVTIFLAFNTWTLIILHLATVGWLPPSAVTHTLAAMVTIHSTVCVACVLWAKLHQNG